MVLRTFRLILPIIIFTRHDITHRVNFQSSDRLHSMIILTFPSYVETSIMNSLTKYSDHKRVIFFEKIKYVRSNGRTRNELINTLLRYIHYPNISTEILNTLQAIVILKTLTYTLKSRTNLKS